jgi:phage tail-like protein
MAETQDPFRAQTFYLELGTHFSGPVMKVTGLSYERDVKTHQQNQSGGKTIISSAPGPYKPGTLTVTKAVSKNMGLWKWRKQVLTEGKIDKLRVNGTVTVYGDNNSTMKWHVNGAWPTRIKGPKLDINSDKATEEIEICYQELLPDS